MSTTGISLLLFPDGYPSGEKPSYSNSQKRSASYYMNGGYAYDNRYLLDANFRADGSSVFGVSNKFTTTWAVGVELEYTQ